MEIFFLSSSSTKVDFLLLFEDKWWKEVFFIDKIILLSEMYSKIKWIP